jgi:hypothetical protein
MTAKSREFTDSNARVPMPAMPPRKNDLKLLLNYSEYLAICRPITVTTIVLITSAAFAVANTIVDFGYIVLDPRIRVQ